MTAGQRAVLAALTDGPLSTREIVTEKLNYPWAYDRAHASLRRLEDRGLVRRLTLIPAGDRGYHWELTHAGRSALNLTG